MSYELHCGDCLEIMPTLAKVDVVVTDPPYGCGKAEWDESFPISWYAIAKEISRRIGIITGSVGLKDNISLIGDDLIGVIAARNLNGMTRSPIGFSNWLACAVSGEKPRQQSDFFEFCIRGDMPNHPSPKPLEYMIKLVQKLSEQGDTILDPFMGSGTTGVACMMTGRNFIGIEKNEAYFKIAEERIKRATFQPSLFTPQPEQWQPVAMFGDD